MLRVISVASAAAGDKYLNITPNAGEVFEVLAGIAYHDDPAGIPVQWKAYDLSTTITYISSAAWAVNDKLSCYALDTASPLVSQFPHGRPIVLTYGQWLSFQGQGLAAGKKLYLDYIVHVIARGVTGGY